MLNILSYSYKDSRLKYLCINLDLVPHKDLEELYPEYHLFKKTDENLLIYSMLYDRYSINKTKILQAAKADYILFKDYEDYVAYIHAHQLGTDLTNLWEKLDEYLLCQNQTD